MDNTMKMMNRMMIDIEAEEEIEWTRMRKVRWENVPDNVNAYLAATRQWNCNESESRIVDAIGDTSLEPADILDIYLWLLSKKDHMITRRIATGYPWEDVWKVAKQPKVDYEAWTHRAPYRGITSTYYEQRLTVRGILIRHTNAMATYMGNYESIQESKAIELSNSKLNKATRIVEKYEKQCHNTYHSKEQIIKDILATLNKYRTGQGSSTLGEFHFTMTNSTMFIDRETGKLIQYDDNNIINEFNKICGEVHETHRQKRKDLLTRYQKAMFALHEISVLWYITWNAFMLQFESPKIHVDYLMTVAESEARWEELTRIEGDEE